MECVTAAYDPTELSALTHTHTHYEHTNRRAHKQTRARARTHTHTNQQPQACTVGPSDLYLDILNTDKGQTNIQISLAVYEPALLY
jgi:hypothetical protein